MSRQLAIRLGIVGLLGSALMPMSGCTTREALIGLGAAGVGAAGGALVMDHVKDDEMREERHDRSHDRERIRAEERYRARDHYYHHHYD